MRKRDSSQRYQGFRSKHGAKTRRLGAGAPRVLYSQVAW